MNTSGESGPNSGLDHRRSASAPTICRRRHVHDGLVTNGQLATADRPPQSSLGAELFGGLLAQRDVEGLDPGPPPALARCMAVSASCRAASGEPSEPATANPTLVVKRNSWPATQKGRAHCTARRPAISSGLAGSGIIADHREHVADEAADGVTGPHRRLEPASELGQDEVPGSMAEAVVDGPEAVGTEDDHRDLGVVAPGPLQALAQPVGYQRPVGSPVRASWKAWCSRAASACLRPVMSSTVPNTRSRPSISSTAQLARACAHRSVPSARTKR